MLEPSERGEIREAWDIYKKHTLASNITNDMVIRDNELTLVTQQDGEIPITENYGYGLYYHDCRYLSGFLIRLMDTPPTRVLSSDERGFKSTLMVTNPNLKDCTGTTVPKETLLGTLATVIPGCVRHTHTIRNFNNFPVTLNLTFEFDADFADMFTIMGIAPPTSGEVLPARFDGKNLYLSYEGEDKNRRNTIIAFDPSPTRIEGKTCTFELTIGPHGSQTVNVEISVEEVKPGKKPEQPVKNPDDRMNQIMKSYITALDCCEKIPTNNNIFNNIMVRSLADLNMMRMSLNGDMFHSAGVPWYDTLFGRDSIISALQLLPFEEKLAKSTLIVNAKFQSDRSDDWRDQEPGKMLHELRLGELANLNLIPQTPYYGTVDSTPLFLILLTEYVNWTGDIELVKKLEGNVDRALKWIDVYANMERNGFAYYAVKSPMGIYNQGWKDSPDSISRSDGSLAKQPVAVAEVQGYVYMAKICLAPLFRQLGRENDAARLEKEAKELKERFNRQFWMKDRQFFAQALDAEGLCDVISSNPAQCLWTGIIDQKYVKYLVNRIFREDMFTEWGIRTLSSKEKRYNPLGYHNGTVWPHENAIIAMGLRKYGFINEMSLLFTGMYEAAKAFEGYRLPECFGGLTRSDYGVPVKYPVACSPQAWASGTMPFMLTSSLGIAPDALNNRLIIKKPHLPSWLDNVQFNHVKVGNTLTDLNFKLVEEETLVNVSKKGGDINVLIEY
ncbi:Glycogen debranching enzyme [Methanosarcina barkeri str. Wiesmoor]|uniref:Glycogen debranching enzyme n=2 Tax=Methanosarcina barkeri TaxID=2208 RepID=A0A0E3QGZ3_METBA|nr:amylo-alpha-1,6-glucosidase [Methanosarcina barkeri]AKB49833.1 Glycogen debranching enzyme [Methanosarcina barkeri str. Wiesmoor]